VSTNDNFICFFWQVLIKQNQDNKTPLKKQTIIYYSLHTLPTTTAYTVEELLPNDFEDTLDFIKVTISRLRRSSSAGSRRGRGGGGVQGLDPHRRNRGGGRGQGCVLRQIHLNVSDLGLGYRSGEEMIFRYCSGPCRRSQTNYDKILYNLLYNRKLPKEDTPSQICCRPIAFDDNLSFLDDNLIYHTVKKHSARKCGCV
uniref:Glial cell line-derived neurotrophic factor n=1 Tax=Gouania willdenowi TaxID=441366 RepID=A0A8C5E7D6_GOUWI